KLQHSMARLCRRLKDFVKLTVTPIQSKIDSLIDAIEPPACVFLAHKIVVQSPFHNFVVVRGHKRKTRALTYAVHPVCQLLQVGMRHFSLRLMDSREQVQDGTFQEPT